MDTIRTELHERLHRLHRLMRRRHMDRRRGGGPLADIARGRGRVLAALQMQQVGQKMKFSGAQDNSFFFQVGSNYLQRLALLNLYRNQLTRNSRIER